MIENAINTLNNFEVVGLPIGKAVGFSLAVATTGAINTLLDKVLPANIPRMPILTSGLIAYLCTLPFVERFLGRSGSVMLSLGALFTGIEQQFQLSTRIRDTVSRLTAGITPAITSPETSSVGYIPATSRIGNAGEIGIGQSEGISDVKARLRMNMK